MTVPKETYRRTRSDLVDASGMPAAVNALFKENAAIGSITLNFVNGSYNSWDRDEDGDLGE